MSSLLILIVRIITEVEYNVMAIIDFLIKAGILVIMFIIFIVVSIIGAAQSIVTHWHKPSANEWEKKL